MESKKSRNSQKRLLNEIKDIIDSDLVDRKHDLNLASTYTNWEIGKRLVQVDQNGESRAEYGLQTLKKLSSDLKKKYGRGFGVANLKNMRQFYNLYKKADIKNELGWTHYMILLRIKDDRLRKKMERLSVKKGWGPGELRVQILVLGNSLSSILERPLGSIGVSQVRRIIEHGKERAFIDLGFGFWMDAFKELSHFEDKELIRLHRSGGALLVDPYLGSREDLWFYQASLDRVIDGDTIVVFIEINLGFRSRQILRLSSLDAPSIFESGGIKAREYVESCLGSGSMFIKTRKKDKYSRYVADVLVGEAGQSLSDVMQKGRFLNQELIDLGLGIRVA